MKCFKDGKHVGDLKTIYVNVIHEDFEEEVVRWCPGIGWNSH